MLFSLMFLSTLARAEDLDEDLQDVHEDVKKDAKEVGEKAGVKQEVLEGGAGYGSAGCGLGSLIFEPSNSFVQVFAATTNGSFGTQTFGITSGTSNCEGPAGSASNVQNFIVANRSALAVEVARGRGEVIQSLATLAACRNDAQLGSTLQSNFKQIFPSASASDVNVGRAIVEVMRNTPSLGCSALG